MVAEVEEPVVHCFQELVEAWAEVEVQRQKGGIGGAGGGEDMPADAGAGEPGFELGLSMLLSGRGGAIVPNKMEANCLAEPACGVLSSSSSSSELSMTDHSSSSLDFALRRLGTGAGSGRA